MVRRFLNSRATSLAPRSESGQVFAILAVSIIAFLAMAALTVDLGRAFLADRQLQASADAAALAGAQELPDPAAAVAMAQQYSGSAGAKNEESNLPGVSTLATTECRSGGPCNPVNAVVVDQEATVGTVFAKILGIDSITVHAHAVAFARDGDANYAIFANDSDCGSFSMKSNGAHFHVEGAIRANGDFEFNGTNMYAEYASAHGPPCKADINGEQVSFGGNPEPDYDPVPQPWPVWFEESQFTCTYSAASFEFNTDNQPIPDGTYCASDLFKIDGNYNSGNITVLAPMISINGTGHVLRPHQQSMLFFATGSEEMILNGFAYDWEGIIFHPGGRVKINGDEDSVLTGMIAAEEVEINGSHFTMIGRGPTEGGTVIRLVE